MLLVIQKDVWRCDCIAGIGRYQDEDDGDYAIQIFQVGVSDSQYYYYDTLEEADKEYLNILTKWKESLGA